MISSLIFAASTALAAAGPQFVLDEHPTLRFSDKTFVLARMRWDYEHRGPGASLPPGKAAWGFVRRRFSVEGSLGGQVAFEIEADLEGEERWKDVYVEYTPSDAFHLRAGKFVVPFGYERTTSLDVIDFAYRSMASSQLVPARDQGVLAFGRVARGKVAYDVGVFEDGLALAGRLVLRPGGGVETGAAMMRASLDEDSSPLSGRTALGWALSPPERGRDGHRLRLSLHGAWRRGPAALKAEYLRARDRQSGSRPFVDGRGWYATGALVLTGEDEADAQHPRRPLFGGGIGSVEVAARTERLQLRDAISGTHAARAHTLGVTWQPHRFFRVQWNAIRDELSFQRMWTRVLRFHLTI